MSYRILVTVSAAALALAAGCKTQSEPTGTTRTTSATTSTATATEGVPAGAPTVAPTTAGVSTVGTSPAEPIAAADKEFMTKASQDAMLEVALGADAVRLGSTPAVREFGERMVKDHSKSDAELRALAAKKGVFLSTELDQDHKKEIERLEKLSGKAFDAEFAKLMVKDHEADVKDFQKQAKDAKDPDLRNWAAKSAPIIEDQLTMAKSMKAKPLP